MFSCTMKRTFALKRADAIVDGRGGCRDGCHRQARHAGFVFPLPEPGSGTIRVGD